MPKCVQLYTAVSAVGTSLVDAVTFCTICITSDGRARAGRAGSFLEANGPHVHDVVVRVREDAEIITQASAENVL